MNAAGKFHIESLLDRLEEIHDEVVGDIKAAEGEDVFVVGPFAFHQVDIEPFLFKKALFDGGKDGRFAGEANVADADFSGTGGSGLWPRAFVAAREEQDGERGNGQGENGCGSAREGL